MPFPFRFIQNLANFDRHGSRFDAVWAGESRILVLDGGGLRGVRRWK